MGRCQTLGRGITMLCTHRSTVCRRAPLRIATRDHDHDHDHDHAAARRQHGDSSFSADHEYIYIYQIRIKFIDNKEYDKPMDEMSENYHEREREGGG